MPGIAHENLKHCGTEILSLLRAAQWLYEGNPIELSATGSMLCTIRRKGKPDERLEPDESLHVTGASLPFLVVEIRHNQSRKDLRKKVHKYVQGSRGHLKIICILELERHNDGCQVFASVIKIEREDSPTEEKPTRYFMKPKTILYRVEVYPKRSSATFDIFFHEVLPKRLVCDPAMSTANVTISLGIFNAYAIRAVDNIQSQRLRTASPVDSDNDDISSPESGVGHISESESDNDDLIGDPTYEDDDSGPEPSCTIEDGYH
ncbi:MAG: hypothetical protein Q9211_005296 [Gyalolechia sp. 1 TL-2023]